VEVSPRQPSAADLFLNVVQVMDPGASPLAAAKIESKGLVGAQVADRVVLFNPAGARTANPVSFTVRANGTLRFLVADLAAGAWQIQRDGQAAQSPVTVSADAGTLYFEGLGGEYTLRK
jgi:hypothetical protein